MIIKRDCVYFKGDMPCVPHKKLGVHCPCKKYRKYEEKYKKPGKKILIIKLAALGDVIRTTPILRGLREKYKRCHIRWVSLYPEVLPSMVDEKYNFDTHSILTILQEKYDAAYNFDKDKLACALLNTVNGRKKAGFYLKDGKSAPYNKGTYHKYITGIFDDYSKKNKKSYVQEIFEIAGLSYKKQEYVFNKPKRVKLKKTLKKPVIGLNTGCGVRWPTRTWPQKHWVELAKGLRRKGLTVILLGGEAEDEKNKRIAKKANVFYPGCFELKKFFGVVNLCDIVVTGVTMALHVAIGLKKKVILLNNIFNKNEFELYNRGVIVEPPRDCLGCYKSNCSKECMELIKPEAVLEKIRLMIDGK